MMKILVIHGSMRKGNTYAFTQEVIKQLKTYNDVQITEIGVADLNLPFCISCHTCFVKGEEYCPHSSILKKVQTELNESDGVIISGVVYAMGLNAAMKNLIDHLAYFFHRPALFGKKGMVITTTAGAGEKGAAKYIKSVMGHWGINGALILTHKAQTVEFKLNDKEQKNVKDTVKKFYSGIKSKREIKPSIESIAVHNAFRSMAAAASPISQRDAEYWQKSGFAHKIYPAKVGFIGMCIGGLTYKAMKKAFK